MGAVEAMDSFAVRGPEKKKPLHRYDEEAFVNEP
jgi:hypothetical protein